MKYKRIAGAAALAVLLVTVSAVPVLANSGAPEDNVVAVGTTDEGQSDASGENTRTGTTTENPLTPDGNGDLVDDATTADDKEFYTVQTDNGDWFYIVIDKQKESDNVYLLNNVTDADLAALAERDDGSSVSAASPEQTSDNSDEDLFSTSGNTGDQTADTVSTETQEETSAEETDTADTATAAGGMSSDMMLIIMVIVVFAGGGIYAYFKIIRPKKNGYSEEYEDDEDFEENENHEGGDEEEIESQLDHAEPGKTNDNSEDLNDLQRRKDEKLC